MAGRMPKAPLSVVFREDQVDAFDRLAQKLSERAAGVPISRLDAIRLAADRGIAALNQELELE